MPAVKFHGKPPFGAIEVQDIRTEIVLAPELEAGESSTAELPPVAVLGVGCAPAQLPPAWSGVRELRRSRVSAVGGLSLAGVEAESGHR